MPAILQKRYGQYVTVESTRKTGLKKFFGPKVGSITVSKPKGPAYPVFRIVVPKWKGGQENEWETLQQCYRKVLQMAADRYYAAIAIPLLEAENPDFPGNIDYKIAVDTIREFLTDHLLDVYLMVCRKNAVPMQSRRADVERYLFRHYSDWGQPWSPLPFADEKSGFDTLAFPYPSPVDYGQEFSIEAPCEYAPAPQAGFRDERHLDAEKEDVSYSCGWLGEDEQELTRKASSAARQRPSKAEAPKKAPIPKASARMPFPSGTKTADRKTGSLPDLDWYLRDMDAGFSETLLKLIDKSGKKDSEIYNKANVSRQHFSKIRNNPNYKPTKPTAIAFAIALELDMEETNDLIGRAGYTLTRSSKFDVIIMYFIQNRNYNMFDINETLYEFDQSLLGA